MLMDSVPPEPNVLPDPKKTKIDCERKRCSICPSKNDKKTQILCIHCSKHVCREHSEIICDNCFYLQKEK